jgi:hypothetical protein
MTRIRSIGPGKLALFLSAKLSRYSLEIYADRNAGSENIRFSSLCSCHRCSQVCGTSLDVVRPHTPLGLELYPKISMIDRFPNPQEAPLKAGANEY